MTKNTTRSVLLAVALTAAVGLWMATGWLSGGEAASDTAAPAAAPERQPVPVTVRESVARPVGREIVVSARTEPNRDVELKAETEGRVVSVGAERGARVERGQNIVGLDMRNRVALVAEAGALVAQRRLEFDAAERLRGRELMSEAQIAEARARLATAEAALERARLDVEYTTITAPFNGFVDDRVVEIGDYVGIGDPIATIVDTDPLIAVGDVSEKEIFTLGVGSRGHATLLGGRKAAGEVRYVSPVASESTRTFRIEVALPNPNGELRAGMSAELSLPAGEVVAHVLSPALLTLDDAGNVGVKTVDATNTVRFHPVEIVRAGNDGIHVTGLPERVTVIIVGQGFVAAGETVTPVTATGAAQISER